MTRATTTVHPRRHGDMPRNPCDGTLRTMYVRRQAANGRPTWERVGVLCDVCGMAWRDKE